MTVREPAGPEASVLGAFRFPEFRALFAGLLPAGIGYWMQEFALSWLVVDIAVQQGDPALAGFYLGLRGIFTAVPSLVFGMMAGVYADRIDRRLVLILTRVASAGVAIALVALIVLDRATLPALLLISAASAAAYAFDPPTRQAILPRIVPVTALFSAMGLLRAALQGSQTVGPLIGGLLIGPFGVVSVVFGKAILMVTSAVMMLRISPQPISEGARSTSAFRSLLEGLSHMRRDDLVRWALILQLIFGVLAQSVIQLLPALAVDGLGVGAVELSWMLAAVGTGTLIGAFLYARMGLVERRGALLLAVMAAVGGTLVVLGLQTALLPAIILVCLLGILQQLFMGMQSVILQLGAPDRLRGRVMGMQSVIFQGLAPIGVLVVGTLGTFIGISNAVVVAGVALTVIALLVYRFVGVISGLRRGVA